MRGDAVIVKLIVIAALGGAVFAGQAAVSEISPLYLVPVLLAGYWLGPLAGGLVGAASALLFGLGREINPPDAGGMDGEVLAPMLIRLGIFSAAGVLVGSLAIGRRHLQREVADQRRELDEMHTIQETLAPPAPPQRPGLELATCYLPAEEGVAGDFYLVAEGANGSTVVAIGDVAGRGLEAAKRAWFVRTVLASSAEFTPDPSQLLELANYSLIEESGRSDTFVTAACLVYEPAEGLVRWAMAGHEPPLLLDSGKPPGEEATPGVPLGIDERIGCTTATFSFRPGNGVLLYTDGLSEARRRNGGDRPVLLGVEGVASHLSRLAGEPPERIVEELRSAAERFSGGRLPDDLCLVAVRAATEPDATRVC